MKDSSEAYWNVDLANPNAMCLTRFVPNSGLEPLDLGSDILRVGDGLSQPNDGSLRFCAHACALKGL